MSMADCPNYPACGHTGESLCDANLCGDRKLTAVIKTIMTRADEMMCHTGREDYHLRKAALLAAVTAQVRKLEAANAERDALQVKIEALEKQEPIGDIRKGEAYFFNGMHTDRPDLPEGALLYAAAGAAQSIAQE